MLSDKSAAVPRSLIIVLTLAVGCFAALFAIEKVYNYDIWWHIKTGQWILAHGTVPSVDTFGFATEGAAWVPHAWLSDVIFTYLYDLLGIDGLVLFKAAIIGMAFGICYLLAVRMGANPFLAAFLIGAAVPIARFRFLLRPHVFTFLLSAIFFYLLCRYNRQKPRQLLVLLPLMLFWVNAHASFMLGILLVGFLLIEALTSRLLARRGGSYPFQLLPAGVPGGTAGSGSAGEDLSSPGAIALLLAGMGLMMFATPHGLALPEWIIQIFITTSVSYELAIEEHAALAWGEHMGFWALMIATATSFVLTWRHPRIFLLLVFLSTSYLAVSSVRYAGFASLLQATMLAINLQTLFDTTALGKFRLPILMQVALFGPLLLLGGWYAYNTTFTETKVYQPGLGIQESRYPVKAVGFLREADFAGNLFNSWKFGGYAQFHLPQAKTLVDGRALDAQVALVEKLAGMNSMALANFVQEQKVQAALIAQTDQRYLDFFNISPAFDLVFSDDQAAVFARRDSEFARKAAQKSKVFRLIQPNSTDFSYLIPLATGPQAAEAEEELRRAIELAPDSFAAHFSLAVFLQALNRIEALNYYRSAADINAALGFIHFDLGMRAADFALKHQQWARAQEFLQQAKQFGDSAEINFLLATTFYMSGDLEQAEKAFEKILATQPDQLSVLINLGFLYIDSDRYSKAIPLFEKARKLAPNMESTLYGLALALQGAGDARAAAHWREFLAQFPQSKWAAKARSHITLQ